MVAVALLCRVNHVLVAIPLECVIETMRPLPVVPIAGAPSFVLGVSVIRGASAVVIDAGLLLADRVAVANRFVTIRVGDRTIALAVSSVASVHALPAESAGELAPLLHDADAIAAIGTLDAELLVTLSAVRLVPEELLARVDAVRAGTTDRVAP